MAIKFEKISAGMKLADVHTERAGNTMMRRIGVWEVEVVEIDKPNRGAMVRWNGNRPEWWPEYRLARLYRMDSPRVVRARKEGR